MTPTEFIRTLYLGDRACKAIAIDGWNGVVRVQVDTISRVRDASGEWSHYTQEDIEDGQIVFTGVDSLEMRNDGDLPNDLINSMEVVEQVGDSSVVEIWIDSVRPDASRVETLLRVRCKGIHLEDPERPGIRIEA